jgi:hypothetical protein
VTWPIIVCIRLNCSVIIVEELAKENYDVLKKNYYMARKKTFTSSLTLFSEL